MTSAPSWSGVSRSASSPSRASVTSASGLMPIVARRSPSVAFPARRYGCGPSAPCGRNRRKSAKNVTDTLMVPTSDEAESLVWLMSVGLNRSIPQRPVDGDADSPPNDAQRRKMLRGQCSQRLRETTRVPHDVPVQSPIGAALLHLHADDERTFLAEHAIVRAAELLFGAHLDRLVDASAARDRGQARAGRRRRGLAARRLVDLVVPDDQRVVPGRLIRDRAQRAEVHQERAVPVEANDAHVRPRERDPERDGRALAHGAERVAVERAVGDLLQVERSLAEIRDDDFASEALGQQSGGGGASQRRAHPCFPPVSSAGKTIATGSERVYASLMRPSPCASSSATPAGMMRRIPSASRTAPVA